MNYSRFHQINPYLFEEIYTLFLNSMTLAPTLPMELPKPTPTAKPTPRKRPAKKEENKQQTGRLKVTFEEHHPKSGSRAGKVVA